MKKEELVIGVAILYHPNFEASRYSASDEDIPYGTLGIFLGMSNDWRKFCAGLEPIDALFGDKRARVYVDEVDLA